MPSSFRSNVPPIPYEHLENLGLISSDWLNTTMSFVTVLNAGAYVNSSTDSAPAFQSALDAAATNVVFNGATIKSARVYVPPGIYMLRSQIVVPAGVSLYGDNSAVCYLWADAARFPVSTAVIRLGRTTETGNQANCFIERMTINCGSGQIAGSQGVLMPAAQENCGVRDCSIVLFRDTGIYVSSCANIIIRNNIIDDYDQGSNYGIHMTGSGGDNLIEKCTVLGNYSTSAIRIYTSHAQVTAVHIEGNRTVASSLPYGLDIDSAAVNVLGLSGHNTVSSLVRLKNDGSVGEKFVGLNIFGGNSAAMIRDETDTLSVISSSYGSQRIGMYVSNNTPITWRDGTFQIRPTGDPSLTVDGLMIHNGNVRIQPAYQLDVQGNAKVAGTSRTLGFYGSTGATKPVINNLSYSSGALASSLAFQLNKLGLVECTSFAP